VILVICLKFKELSIGKRSMYINISGWHTFDFGKSSSCMVASRCRWRSVLRWRKVWKRCTCSVSPRVCVRILCCAILARKAAFSLIFMNHCQVYFRHRLHNSMPITLNSPPLLFSDFSTRFCHQQFHFVYCGAQKPCFGHFGQVQCTAHVGLF